MSAYFIYTVCILFSLILPTKKDAPDNNVSSNLISLSEDGGKTWRDIGTSLPQGTTAGTVYADQNMLYLYTNKGLFQTIGDGKKANWTMDLNLKAGISHFISGGARPIVRSFDDGFLQKAPGIGVWQPIFEDLRGHLIYNFVFRKDGNVLISGSTGILKAKINERPWKKKMEGNIFLDLFEKDGVLIAGGELGVARSTDGGETWNTTLSQVGFVTKTIELGGQIYAISRYEESAYQFVMGPENQVLDRLYRSGDNGLTWERLDAKLPNVKSIFDITQVGNELFCSLAVGLYKSSDNGLTWQQVLPAAQAEKFNKLAAKGNKLYVIQTFAGC
ncbi:MAG TPA: hypothetical protein PLZ32_08290 [Saprospiraceae bacterium]|nr:hypothetical protein [Saprospiraceae bacterium]